MVDGHTCNICGKWFRRRGALQSHQHIHTGIKPYQCKVCGKSYTRVNTLRRHRMTHTDEKSYECDFCGKRFVRSDVLQKHRQLVHIEGYNCEICGKHFRQEERFNQHLETHTDETRFHCKVCSLSYKDTYNLGVHERIHNGKGSQCDICGKWFSWVRDMEAHRQTHNCKKPYICSHEPSNLARHQKLKGKQQETLQPSQGFISTGSILDRHTDVHQHYPFTQQQQDLLSSCRQESTDGSTHLQPLLQLNQQPNNTFCQASEFPTLLRGVDDQQPSDYLLEYSVYDAQQVDESGYSHSYELMDYTFTESGRMDPSSSRQILTGRSPILMASVAPMRPMDHIGAITSSTRYG